MSFISIGNVPSTNSYGLFAQTSNSTPISATIVESSLIGSGVGTLSVPANGFSIGDSFVSYLGGTINAGNNETLTIRIKTSSGIILSSSGTITLATSTNRHWTLETRFTIRTIGAPSVASIISESTFSYTRNAGTNVEGYIEDYLNNTTFDTTISNTLDITAQWGSTSASNSIYSSNFTLVKVF